MAKVNNKEIYEVKEWLNDTPQNRSGLSALVSGGVTVEQLNVTENGTYAETGKAYSPVVVNVAGGSSDLSVAEVTLVNSSTGTVTPMPAPLAFPENAVGEGAPAMAFPTMAMPVEAGNTATIQVILYKGKGAIDLTGNSTYFEISVSGDIETNFAPGWAVVEGNGTITFTDPK